MPPSDRSPIASAELLAIGAELLVGETRDTNSGDLARALTDLGVEVRRMTQLPDELDAIAEAVTAALGRVDLVVTSGGLGPTPDDLTREGIAAALGEQPAVDPGLEAWLRDLWAKRGLPFSSVNLKQAWLIPSASALDNPNGTAPGWWVETGSRIILALPGPPRELLPMWQDQALPRLRARGLGLDRAAVTLRLTGIGESAVVDLVGADVLASRNPQLATYARPDSVDLRISATGDGARSAEALVEEAVASLSPRLDAYVFARDEDDWAVALAGRLGTRRVATVEVGTGGYLALLLGSAPFLVHAAVHGATALRGQRSSTRSHWPGRHALTAARRSASRSWPTSRATTCEQRWAWTSRDRSPVPATSSSAEGRSGADVPPTLAPPSSGDVWAGAPRTDRPRLARWARPPGAGRTRGSGDGQHRQAGRRADRHASGHLAGHVAHDLRGWPWLPLRHGRHAGITTVTHLDVQRDAAEEVQLVAGREALATTLAEDRRGFAAVRAQEGTHVLHEAQDGHGEAPEHREGLLHV